MNTLRRAIEIKEATGGWADPGEGTTGRRACLVINICRAVRLEMGGYFGERQKVVEENKAIVREVLKEQHPELYNPLDPEWRGTLVEAHASLPAAELDRIMDKAAVIQEGQV